MGLMKKICVGATAVISSALLGYLIYKSYFQSEEKDDDDENVSSKTELNSARINEAQSVNPVSVNETVGEVNINHSNNDVHEGSKTSHNASGHQPKTKSKPKTGYMGLHKGFLL